MCLFTAFMPALTAALLPMPTTVWASLPPPRVCVAESDTPLRAAFSPGAVNYGF